MTEPATLPLKPIETEHRAGLEAMIGRRRDLEALAARVVAAGLRNVYLTGSGGGFITVQPLHYQLEQRATHFSVFSHSANELIYRNPAGLGSGSLILLASNTGTTPEVVAAATFAKQHGATVVAFTRLADSALARASDEAYTYGDDHGVGDPKEAGLALLGLALLRETGDMEAAEYAAHVRAIEALPDTLIEAVQETETLNAAIASAFRDESLIYILGSGPNHSTAYCLAMCYLQEMQWKHAVSFDAAEFLHGAMEVVTDETPVILFLGEETTRPIDERAKAFLLRYTRRAFFIDSRDLSLTGVDPALRGYVSTFALAAVMSRLAQHFEAATGHDLKIRRYMFKVDY